MPQDLDVTSRPLAAEGYDSYRYKGAFGWIMIGANSNAEALGQARLSISDPKAVPSLENLQRWNGSDYVACQGPSKTVTFVVDARGKGECSDHEEYDSPVFAEFELDQRLLDTIGALANTCAERGISKISVPPDVTWGRDDSLTLEQEEMIVSRAGTVQFGARPAYEHYELETRPQTIASLSAKFAAAADGEVVFLSPDETVLREAYEDTPQEFPSDAG